MSALTALGMEQQGERAGGEQRQGVCYNQKGQHGGRVTQEHSSKETSMNRMVLQRKSAHPSLKIAAPQGKLHKGWISN